MCKGGRIRVTTFVLTPLLTLPTQCRRESPRRGRDGPPLPPEVQAVLESCSSTRHGTSD